MITVKLTRTLKTSKGSSWFDDDFQRPGMACLDIKNCHPRSPSTYMLNLCLIILQYDAKTKKL